MIGSGALHPKIVQRLYNEVKAIRDEPTDGITAQMNDECYSEIHAEITGPDATPYEKGLYKVILKIPDDFPKSAPKGVFLTKIFHPNISEKGEICVNTLKRDWDPLNWSIRHILKIVHCLLINPFPESALNEEAGKMFMENYEQYVKRAKIFNDIHAATKTLTKVKRSEYMIEEVKSNNTQERLHCTKENKGQEELQIKSQNSNVLSNVSSNQMSTKTQQIGVGKIPASDSKKPVVANKKKWNKMI